MSYPKGFIFFPLEPWGLFSSTCTAEPSTAVGLWPPWNQRPSCGTSMRMVTFQRLLCLGFPPHHVPFQQQSCSASSVPQGFGAGQEQGDPRVMGKVLLAVGVSATWAEHGRKPLALFALAVATQPHEHQPRPHCWHLRGETQRKSSTKNEAAPVTQGRKDNQA